MNFLGFDLRLTKKNPTPTKAPSRRSTMMMMYTVELPSLFLSLSSLSAFWKARCYRKLGEGKNRDCTTRRSRSGACTGDIIIETLQQLEEIGVLLTRRKGFRKRVWGESDRKSVKTDSSLVKRSLRPRRDVSTLIREAALVEEDPEVSLCLLWKTLEERKKERKL